MNKVLNQVAATMEQAEEDGVSVPSTVEEYTASGKSTDHDELEAMDELDDDYGYMEVEDYEDDMEDYDCDEDQSEEEEEDEANGADGNSAVIATSTDNANATSTNNANATSTNNANATSTDNANAISAAYDAKAAAFEEDDAFADAIEEMSDEESRTNLPCESHQNDSTTKGKKCIIL